FDQLPGRDHALARGGPGGAGRGTQGLEAAAERGAAGLAGSRSAARLELLVDHLQGDELGKGGAVDEAVHRGLLGRFGRSFVVTNLAVRPDPAIGQMAYAEDFLVSGRRTPTSRGSSRTRPRPGRSREA